MFEGTKVESNETLDIEHDGRCQEVYQGEAEHQKNYIQ